MSSETPARWLWVAGIRYARTGGVRAMRFQKLGSIAAAAAIVTWPGCAARLAPAAPGPPDEPRASWVIRSGDYGNEREVCRSDTNQRCVLQASSDAQPVSVEVAVYLFPAKAPTTYSGAFMSAFI